MANISRLQQHSANPTYIYIDAFVDELQRAGVHDVVICPGSRSTPLTMAFASQARIRVWMHCDERSAAYFGLGLARQARQAVALLCTSGTAAANFLPALVEARLSRVPLVVLTADRPHELRDNGAPQSIDQNRLYGTYAKWFVEVALPEASDGAMRYIRTTAARAVACARTIPAGPVHLNFPLREPLTPEPLPADLLPPVEQRDPLAWEGRAGQAPYIAVEQAAASAGAPETLSALCKMLRAAERGLIVAGPLDDPALPEALLRLAQRLGYPILADPLSQLRCGEHDRSMVLSTYDTYLRSDSFCAGARPELILRFGAIPTSKALQLYLKRHAACPLVVVDGNVGWEEPTQLAAQLLHADPAALCQRLLDILERQQTPPSHVWMQLWRDAEQVSRQTLLRSIQAFSEPFEGRIFSELADLLPDGTTLYAGNSMPVRDLDTFFWSSARRVRIMGNRGANGIDGVVSSALGASAAAGEGKPVLLVLGDLSFFHDLNGLLAARLHRLNLTIVLVNNDGGGIFSFLPQAAYPEHFEQLFATPTGLDFRLAVEMYGGQYHRVANWELFRKAVSHGLHNGGLQVIEISTQRSSNVNMHRLLWECVDEALTADAGGDR